MSRNWLFHFTRALLIFAVALTGLTVAAGNASAEVVLDASLLNEGQSVPYRPALVAVELDADRGERGEVTITAGPLTLRREIDLAGEGTSRVLFVVPIGWTSEIEIRWRGEDGSTVTSLGVANTGDDELIGSLGGASGLLPDSFELAGTGDLARVVQLPDDILLELPEVIHTVDQLAVTADDLSSLDPDVAAQLSEWLHLGGHLLVLGEPPAPGSTTLADALFEGGRAATSGTVIVVPEVGLADVDGMLLPAPPPIDERFENVQAGGRIVDLGGGTQIPLPSFPALLGVVGIYVILVGPVLRRVLAKRRQELAWWWIVPLAAVATTGAVMVIGGGEGRSGGRVSDITVIEYNDSGNFASAELTYVGGGADLSLEMPDGWRIDNGTEPFRDRMSVFQRGGRLETQGLGDGSTYAAARGPAPGVQAPVSADFTFDENGPTGTATNEGPTRLEDVQLTDGLRFVPVGALESGETAEFDWSDSQPRWIGVGVLDDIGFQEFAVDDAALDRRSFTDAWVASRPGTVLGAERSITVLAWEDDAGLLEGFEFDQEVERVAERRLHVAEFTASDPAAPWSASVVNLSGRGHDRGFDDFLEPEGKRLATDLIRLGGAPEDGLVVEFGSLVENAQLFDGAQWYAIDVDSVSALPPEVTAADVLFMESVTPNPERVFGSEVQDIAVVVREVQSGEETVDLVPLGSGVGSLASELNGDVGEPDENFVPAPPTTEFASSNSGAAPLSTGPVDPGAGEPVPGAPEPLPPPLPVPPDATVGPDTEEPG